MPNQTTTPPAPHVGPAEARRAPIGAAVDDRRREHERDQASYAAARRLRELLIAAGRDDEVEP